MGITGLSHIDRRHWLSPERSEAAPADRHGVELLHRSRRQQRPLLIKLFKNIRCKIHFMIHNNSFLSSFGFRADLSSYLIYHRKTPAPVTANIFSLKTKSV